MSTVDAAGFTYTSGDRVELRPAAEILATLDENGCLEGLPFMPEMLQYFGKTYTVDATVARACDTIDYTGVRRLRDTVLLDDLRCDGSGHAGCGALCRIYWKAAWLRPTDASRATTASDDGAFAELEQLARHAAERPDSTPEARTFRCQATELLRASEPTEAFSFSSFFGELRSGNVSFLRWVRIMGRILIERRGARLGLVSSKPFSPEQLAGQKSFVPDAPREFKPGDLVQIRSKEEIRRTLGENGSNRGLWFDREMVPYCGRTARVKTRVDRFVDEPTGNLVELGSDCYILDDVYCKSEHSHSRWFCPRAIYPWWRECWLEPADSER